MDSVDALLCAIENQTNDINELLGLVIQQREAICDGNLEGMQDVMKLFHSASLKAQKGDVIREKAAGVLAEELGCEKKLSSILDVISADEEKSTLLRSAGEALIKAANAANAESKILQRLIDEGQKFNDMMMSELRRFDSGVGFGAVSMDLKG